MRGEKLCPPGQAAKLLEISFITIKRWIYAGRVKAIRLRPKGIVSQRAESNGCSVNESQKIGLSPTHGFPQ